MNIKFILYVLGALLVIEGGLLLLPPLVSLIYGEPDLLPLLLSAGIALAVGGLFMQIFKGASKDIGKREGFIVVTAVWIVYAFFGSLPFVFSGYVPSLTDAFFEAMSGFTTTGGTILVDIEALPHGLLFWRSLTHFIGGIGILVLGIAILPIFGMGSMTIYHAETSNAAIGEKLSPRIKDTAKHVFRIYLVLNVACILLYLPEMGLFDAVCHAFSTTASGGFSTKNASMGAYTSYSQYVSVIFMILAGTNFVLLFYIWKRDFSKVTRSDEFRSYLIIILSAFLFLFAGLLITGHDAERSVREGLFHAVSILTTTGYAVSDYTLWSPPLWFILFLLAFVGGCAGSTAGGMKVVRFILFLRTIPVQIKKLIHQNAVIRVRINEQNVAEDKMFRTLSFFIIFLCVFTAGAFLLMICGLDFTSSVGASVACLGNTGPGLGSVGPANSFVAVPAAGKWVCSFLMLLGRLELYSILILFSPSFWIRQ
jgi:trk system potassium uptake protein TrkH